MLKRDMDEVRCRICCRYFDPSESDGWCTNPACGEWQYAPCSDVDAGKETPTKSCPDCENDVPEDDHFCGDCGRPLSCPNCDFDLSRHPAEQSRCPRCTELLRPQTEPEGEECPVCGEEFPGIPGGVLVACPHCEAVLEKDDETIRQTERILDEPGTLVNEKCPNCKENLPGIPSGVLVACSSCEVVLEKDDERIRQTDWKLGKEGTPVHEKCPSCEENLPEIPGGLLVACPHCEDVLKKDDGTIRRIDRELTEDEGGTRPVEKCPNCKENLPQTPSGVLFACPECETVLKKDVIRRTGRVFEDPAPDQLVLDVLGTEIRLEDGETVGKEIRTAMMEAGEGEDAMYVHREHVRIDVEGDDVYLTRLGENSLEINGEPVEKGSRAPIEDGDEISFSKVVDATVSISRDSDTLVQ